MVKQMRQITDAAAASTRKARRDRERRPVAPRQVDPVPVPPPPEDAGVEAPPFKVIEQW